MTGLNISGADNGVRTRDPHLGKVVLYQLSHVRVAKSYISSCDNTAQGKISKTLNRDEFMKGISIAKSLLTESLNLLLYLLADAMRQS